jgi:putative heme-binding domain-containing protein
VAALARPRDPKHGREVFDKQCAKCHVIEGRGYKVGPDLSVITRKSDEMLVSDVLDPSNQITLGYNNYTVITEDGRIFTGVLAAETATSVTLRREEAKDTVLLRQNVETIAASSGSMMPENLEKEVAAKDLADLIAYLRQAFGAPGTNVATLFDDDAGLVALLNEGRGTARIRTGDRYSGSAALAIGPPQRFSAKIPGWEYRIREKPGPGEFRYLRLAWKSAGDGVMIELADAGRWAGADKPLRRYYSGANTTGWAGRQLSPRPPKEWTVVTCDLWKDCGDFTLTGIAPTAMGGEALFDEIELLRESRK